MRNEWLALEDEALLKQCRVEVCRGTGPGGQKRNKTSTSVRLFHLPSGVSAENDETRSQHQNKSLALKSLRLKIALTIRCNEAQIDAFPVPGINSSAFARWVAIAFDALSNVDFRISEAAPMLGLSTSRLAKELAKSPQVWQAVNAERTSRNLSPLINNG